MSDATWTTVPKPPLGTMTLLHAAPADPVAACMYCGKAQPWGPMEPCDGPLPLRAENTELRDALKKGRLAVTDTEFLLKHCHDLEEAVGTQWSPATVTRIREIALRGESFEAFQERRSLGDRVAPDGGDQK